MLIAVNLLLRRRAANCPGTMTPNAPGERRPTGMEPRMSAEPTLWAVRSTAFVRGFGGCAASQVEGTGGAARRFVLSCLGHRGSS